MKAIAFIVELYLNKRFRETTQADDFASSPAIARLDMYSMMFLANHPNRLQHYSLYNIY